jgi:hypothetical protein
MDQQELNEQALTDPHPGDYWHEMFCPYFLVVAVNGRKITVLSALGGPNSFDRKEEICALVDNGDGTWSWDVTKSIVVDHEWMKDTVMYKTISGFVADVVRNDRHRAVAKEWIAYRVREMKKELDSLGPMAIECMLREKV